MSCTEYVCCHHCLTYGGAYWYGLYLPVCPWCAGLGVLEVQVETERSEE